MLPVRRRTLALLSAGIAAAAVLATGPVSSAAADTAGPRLIYTAPDGSGTQCSSQAPCSITTAQVWLDWSRNHWPGCSRLAASWIVASGLTPGHRLVSVRSWQPAGEPRSSATHAGPEVATASGSSAADFYEVTIREHRECRTRSTKFAIPCTGNSR